MAVVYVLLGIIGGVLGGMGMGGGTLLIPLLTTFASLSQRLAQGVNLLAFLPMAVVVCILHFKNGLIDKKGIIYIILPAVAFAVLGSILAFRVPSVILKRTFGAFLILLAFYEVYALHKNRGKKE